MTNRRMFLIGIAIILGYFLIFHTSEYAPFSLLGVLGAIFANATGAGGGIVFIPAFQQLGVSAIQSVGTSFAIQCFGMTTGSIAWLGHARTCDFPDWRLLPKLVSISLPFSVLGIWLVYGFQAQTPGSLSSLFAYFSIVIGLGLLIVNTFNGPKQKLIDKQTVKQVIDRQDTVALAIISLIGGVVTAWLSVGVGEFVAFYLILRGYRVTLAIAAAVIISAGSVWSGVGYHLINDTIYWDILIFAGPGAVIGAIIAKKIATRLPVMQLKMFFAIWVLFAGLFELFN